ncbi:MAG: hypothetical protein L3J35_11410 [Bacteroidales bacterium]|nr:hypothetical protein [Bacteroidales bacterium]
MTSEKEKIILDIIKKKSILKQKVFTNTYKVFSDLKSVLSKMEVDYNKQLKKDVINPPFKYKNISDFQCELKVAGDILVFQMHSNIFEFDRDHGVWKITYVQNNEMATYSGIINIYNFLADSFKYNRVQDLGYLVGRIFINKDFHYFVEGKRQMGFLYNDFGNDIIDKDKIKKVVDTAIAYSLEFDLLVPPYDNLKVITVEQIENKRQNGQIQTGKRLGFGFRSDDVQGEQQDPVYTGG